MRRRARWTALVALLVFTAALLGGCWSRVELNDIALVLGLAVDLGEEEAVRVTLHVPRPVAPQQAAGLGGAQEPVWVVAREAGSLSDALALIRLASPRRLVFHHLRVVLIGEEYARRYGIGDVLDFLATNQEIRLTARPFLVEGRAQEVLETLPQLRALQPFNLTGIQQAKGRTDWRLKDLLVARASVTHSVWIPTVRVIQRPAGTPHSPLTGVELSGVALFRRDYLQRILGPPAYQVIAWFLGDPSGFTITAPCPAGSHGTISATVLTGRTRVRPRWEGDGIAFRVEVSTHVNVMRSECQIGELKDAPVRELVERILAEDLHERVEQFIRITQESVTDPVGFGKYAQMAFPQYYKRMEDHWGEQLWPRTPVEVVARVTVDQAGLVTGPVHPTERELREGLH